MRLLRAPAVRERVALSQSEITRRRKLGIFPEPVTLGARAVAWLESDIDAWLAAIVAGADDDAIADLVASQNAARQGVTS